MGLMKEMDVEAHNQRILRVLIEARTKEDLEAALKDALDIINAEVPESFVKITQDRAIRIQGVPRE